MRRDNAYIHIFKILHFLFVDLSDELTGTRPTKQQ